MHACCARGLEWPAFILAAPQPRCRATITTALVAISIGLSTVAQAGPLTFTTYLKKDGLLDDQLWDIAAVGDRVYAATWQGGLGISNDAGKTWTNVTTLNGLNNNHVRSVHAVGDKVYAGTLSGLNISHDRGATWSQAGGVVGSSQWIESIALQGGTLYACHGALSISNDGGATFTTITAAGLGTDAPQEVSVSGTTIAVATLYGGVKVSLDGGATWTSRTKADGLLSNDVRSIHVSGGTIYAGTYEGGLGISTDGGATWWNRTMANGLGFNTVLDVLVRGSEVYAGTTGGLSVSNDGGSTWTNYTTADGLGWSWVNGLSIGGGRLYAGTLGGVSVANLPTAVPEIDPTGMGSVAALVMAGTGLLERRRAGARGRRTSAGHDR